VIVGDYLIDSEGDIRGFVYQDGKFTDVGPQGCIESAGAGINDQGEIVGWCADSSNVVHGYLWNGESYSSLDYPGANNFTLAWGINNAGLVTLQWIDSAGNYEGAVYDSKTKKYSNPIIVPGELRPIFIPLTMRTT
jgi:probable HAF family extracellular repeat protein